MPRTLIACRRVLVLALLASLTSMIIAACYPDVSSDLGGATSDIGVLSGFWQWGWITAQAFLLTVPGVLVAFALQRRAPGVAIHLGSLLVLVVPALMLIDAITFRWIGDRFLSAAMWRVSTQLRPGLMGHVTDSMIVGGAGLFGGLVVLFASSWWSAKRVSEVWIASKSLPGPGCLLAACTILAFLVSTPSLVNFARTQRAMAQESSKHPLCVVGLVPFRGVGEETSVSSNRVITNSFQQALVARDHQQRRLGVDDGELGNQRLPDIVIVVVESFRRELIAPDVMPNLWRYARSGVHCRCHFSGGNATTHGMFSLLNGLEAIWYERPVRYSPLLNRLFQSAGYELGFFAGHDDWRNFYMDGYISEEQFDVFETSQPSGLASDRRATELAARFLDRRDRSDSDKPRPRLALLYLYATHATYNSYPQDQVFTPAADQRLLYPYSESSQPQVWNRYKNSARTVDRFLAAVLREDRVGIVTGDHGESFLEDGTIGHGIRISEYQNMTPAIIFVPRGHAREIDVPTSHADLLPTLLAASGLRATDGTAFDGVNLLSTPEESLSVRCFVTRNYLANDVALIGPWTSRRDQPFAYRASVSLGESKLSAINAIDPYGYARGDSGTLRANMNKALRQWLDARFGLLRQAVESTAEY